MISRVVLLLGVFFLNTFSYAQIKESFDVDHDWLGDTADFSINTQQQLQLTAAEAGTSFISTPSSLLKDSVVWEFFIELDFNPSGSNFSRVYLASDKANLDNELTGYHIMIGDSEDEISLYFQEGKSHEYIINGQDDLIDLSSVQAKIRVIKSKDHLWQLYADVNQNGELTLLGSAVHQPGFVSNYAGWHCQYTKTRADKFFLDDFIVTGSIAIDSVSIASPDTVFLWMNQEISTTESTDWKLRNIDSGSELAIKKVATNGDAQEVVMEDSLYTGNFSVQVDSVTDAFGNLDLSVLTHNFFYQELKVRTVSTTTDTILNVAFNQELSDASQVIFSWNAGGPEIKSYSITGSELEIRFRGALMGNKKYSLVINGVDNGLQNSAFHGNVDFEYLTPFFIDSLIKIADNQVKIIFSKELKNEYQKSFFWLERGNILPAEIVRTAPRNLQLTFAKDFSEGENLLIIDSVQSIDDQYITKEKKGFRHIPVELDSISTEANKIYLYFNQSLRTPTSAQFLTDQAEAQISLEHFQDSIIVLEALNVNRSDYQLFVLGIANNEGNSTFSDTLSVFFNVALEPGDVLITELMPDPTPALQQPAAEYIELYNNSTLPIELGGLRINEDVLAAFLLAPGDYLLVTDEDDVDLFHFENIIGVTSMGALTNSGESVVLRNPDGTLIDSLNFDRSWYDGDFFDDGGYALENINYTINCHDDFNWTASSGSPGRPNLMIDSTLIAKRPEATLVIVDSVTLRIEFSRPVLKDSIKFLVNQEMISELTRLSYSKLQLNLSIPLVSEAYHEILIHDFYTCEGRSFQIDPIDFYYDRKAPVLLQHKVLARNEVALIFDEPLKKSRAEKEDHYFIEKHTILKATLQDTAANRVHLILDKPLSSGAISIQNLEDTLDNVLKRQIVDLRYESHIRNADVVTTHVLEVIFLPDTFLIKALEFLIPGLGRPLEVIQAPGDGTYRLLFDQEIKENRDYRLYFESLSGPSDAIDFRWDTEPPEISLQIRDSLSIKLFSNEKLDLVSAINMNHYHVEERELEDVILLSDTSVLLSFKKEFEQEKQLELILDGVSDLKGNVIENEKIDFQFDSRPPIIKNIFPFYGNRLNVLFHEVSFLTDSLQLLVENEEYDSILYQSWDSLSWMVDFKNRIPVKNAIEVIINNFQDRLGNTQRKPIKKQVNTHQGYINDHRFRSDSLLELIFSTNLKKEQQLESSITTSEAINIMSVEENRILINLSAPLSNGDSLSVNIDSLACFDARYVQDTTIVVAFENHLEKVEFIDSTSFLVYFKKPLNRVENGVFMLVGEQLEARNHPGNDQIVQIFLKEPISSNREYRLSWYSLTDQHGRHLPGHSILINYDTRPPKPIEIRSFYSGVLQLKFDENPVKLSNTFSVLIEGKRIQSYRLSNEYTLQITHPDLSVGAGYELVIQGIMDLHGNRSNGDTIQFTYQPPVLPLPGDIILNEFMPAPTEEGSEYIELYNASEKTIDLGLLTVRDAVSQPEKLPDHQLTSGSYAIISKERQDFSSQNANQLVFQALPSLNNSGDEIILSDLLGNKLDAIRYDESKEGVAIERINPDIVCDTMSNWSYSLAESGGTPGLKNSVFSPEKDEKGPVVFEISVIDSVKISISFDEDIANIVLDSATFTGFQQLDSRNIEIELVRPLEEGIFREITIRGFYDCTGNENEKFLSNIGLPKAPTWHDLLITEIMYDPEPGIGLPEREYIEIINVSDYVIDLAGLTIKDTELSSPIGGAIWPDEYLVLTDVEDFGGFDFTRVRKWRSLSNTGERISLQYEGREIHAVNYNPSLINKESEGGISLEMLSLGKPCHFESNWKLSKDKSGGTPGRENSHYSAQADEELPMIKGSTFVENGIEIQFTESIHQMHLPIFTVSQGPDFYVKWDTLVFDYCFLSFTDDIETDSLLFTVGEFRDCVGNTNGGEIFHVYVPSADVDSLFISEVMFDTDDPGLEFIEIFNASGKIYDIGKLRLVVDGTGKALLEQQSLLFPGEYVAVTSDSARLGSTYFNDKFEQQILQSNLPNLRNEDGTLLLYHEETLVDSVYYHADFQSPFLRNVKNVSLERISYTEEEAKGRNWASSSGLNNYATPGYQNSQAAAPAKRANRINISPKVFVPGGKNGRSAITTINYDFEGHNIQMSAYVYDTSGKEIFRILDGLATSSKGYVRWDGMTRDGRFAAPGRYIIYVEAIDSEGFHFRDRSTVVVGW